MEEKMQIRSISFDTSFLLKENLEIDKVIQIIARDQIPSFITSTVISELEQLKIWGRITSSMYHHAIKRWKHAHATPIDFRNRFLSDAFGRSCMQSMEKHHGVKKEDIANDCSIVVSILKNGVDLFLSEDFHFTSRITKEVIQDLSNAACTEYHQMCDATLYSIDAKTFLKAYSSGYIDLDIVHARMKSIRKSGKRLGNPDP